ncbi:unnamed protein product [Effrenium voratum]|nr:unnamed protein product [Effrenium voratum]
MSMLPCLVVSSSFWSFCCPRYCLGGSLRLALVPTQPGLWLISDEAERATVSRLHAPMLERGSSQESLAHRISACSLLGDLRCTTSAMRVVEADSWETFMGPPA